jgi:hypothetical protein
MFRKYLLQIQLVALFAVAGIVSSVLAQWAWLVILLLALVSCILSVNAFKKQQLEFTREKQGLNRRCSKMTP